MKSTKTLTEAHNYLVYIADALYSVSQQFSVDRSDRVMLEKFSQDLFAYSKSLEILKNNIFNKEQMKKKELEEIQEK
jgi:hypothetical protein